jgi:hypothetical protein
MSKMHTCFPPEIHWLDPAAWMRLHLCTMSTCKRIAAVDHTVRDAYKPNPNHVFGGSTQQPKRQPYPCCR